VGEEGKLYDSPRPFDLPLYERFGAIAAAGPGPSSNSRHRNHPESLLNFADLRAILLLNLHSPLSPCHPAPPRRRRRARRARAVPERGPFAPAAAGLHRLLLVIAKHRPSTGRRRRRCEINRFFGACQRYSGLIFACDALSVVLPFPLDSSSSEERSRFT